MAFTGKTMSLSDVYYDETTEWRLLAALLEKRNVDFLHRMTPLLFTEDRIRVFTAMQNAFQAYGVLDLEGLQYYLNGELPGELLASQGANIRSTFDEAARLATKRVAKEKAEAFERIARQFNPNDNDIAQALTFTSVTSAEDSSLTSGAVEFLGNLHAKRSKTYRFASTGLPWLDVRMGGEWKPRSFVVIAAPPGGGKTTLLANSMLYMSKQVNKETGEPDPTHSLFFSLEMAKEDLFVKWAADLLNIDSKHIASGRITDEQASQVENVISELQALPMYVIDNSKITLFKMVKEVREHVAQKGVRVVFIDYIQIVNHSPSNNTNSDLGEVAETMKALAKELNITIVALSQLNRTGQGLDGIRDSGEIAQVADVVVKLAPESESGDLRTIEVDFLKNRFGPIGKTSVLFYGPFQRFQGMSEEVYNN